IAGGPPGHTITGRGTGTNQREGTVYERTSGTFRRRDAARHGGRRSGGGRRRDGGGPHRPPGRSQSGPQNGQRGRARSGPSGQDGRRHHGKVLTGPYPGKKRLRQALRPAVFLCPATLYRTAMHIRAVLVVSPSRSTSISMAQVTTSERLTLLPVSTEEGRLRDRKSTRLNSSHGSI